MTPAGHPHETPDPPGAPDAPIQGRRHPQADRAGRGEENGEEADGPLLRTTAAHTTDVRRASGDAGLRFAVHAIDVDAIDDLVTAVTHASARQENDQQWGSLRYVLHVVETETPSGERGMASTPATIVVKQWVNDWWPPAAADLSMRIRGAVRRFPSSDEGGGRGRDADHDDSNERGAGKAEGERAWVLGSDHKGYPAASTIASGTNVEVRFPEDWVYGQRLDPRIPRILQAIQKVGDGPVSWLERAYHPHRDIPDRGWGDGLVARLDWAPFVAAPEHEDCPTPDLLRSGALPSGWKVDATGARRNPRLAHAERQWVIVDAKTGDPVVWARAVPMVSRHPHPLLARADARYRLEWTETPVGWAGSLDTDSGHHVILLERDALRIEVWVSLAADMDRGEAAVMADRLFGSER